MVFNKMTHLSGKRLTELVMTMSRAVDFRVVLFAVVLAMSSVSAVNGENAAAPMPDAQQAKVEGGGEDKFHHKILKVIDKQQDLGFTHAFLASLSVIIVSELGDKTFFIAAIMAMRHSRIVVFAGAIGALALMTVLSALLGFATTVIPRWFTYYASTALFLLFGLKMIREGYYMSPDEAQEEYDEVQAELRKREQDDLAAESTGQDVETGVIKTPSRRWWMAFCSRIFLQSFTLTFLAEWGDRSQITTIILAAREDVMGVIIGGTLGHALCTGLAVLGGKLIAQRISVRTVTLIGGFVFIIFALSAFVINRE